MPGQISLSIRNAIRAGLFDGPRVMAAGRYVTTHQGLTDWYPTWIGAPETSIGKLVTNIAEAVEEIRRQVKDGVDCIKIALDGIQRRDNGELVAAFNQEETEAMVRETHRLGKKAVVHARGREATLYAARSGVDLIFHANHLDDECIAAMLETGSAHMPDPDPAEKRHRLYPAARTGRAKRAPRRRQARIRHWLRQLEKGARGWRSDDDRNRYRVRRDPVRRMECARARVVCRRPRLYPGRGVAGGDRGQCAAL